LDDLVEVTDNGIRTAVVSGYSNEPPGVVVVILASGDTRRFHSSRLRVVLDPEARELHDSQCLPPDWGTYQIMIDGREKTLDDASKGDLIRGLVDAINALEDIETTVDTLKAQLTKWRTGR
jgi:hypothetical protein